jgi:hypothetical protein
MDFLSNYKYHGFFRAGYSAYVPIHAAKRIGKVIFNQLKMVRFFLIIFKIATLFSPLKMFLPIAIVLFLMATGWYGYTFMISSFYQYECFIIYRKYYGFSDGFISEQITSLMYKDSE